MEAIDFLLKGFFEESHDEISMNHLLDRTPIGKFFPRPMDLKVVQKELIEFVTKAFRADLIEVRRGKFHDYVFFKIRYVVDPTEGMWISPLEIARF